MMDESECFMAFTVVGRVRLLLDLLTQEKQEALITNVYCFLKLMLFEGCPGSLLNNREVEDRSIKSQWSAAEPLCSTQFRGGSGFHSESLQEL